MATGDVYWVEFPPANGHEQAGRRPAVVLQDASKSVGLPLVLLVPLTGTSAALRFSGTLAVKATPENGLSQDSVAMVFQLRGLDRRRFRTKIGTMDPTVVAEIFRVLDELMGRQPPLPPASPN